jgi:hypothetical protein
MIILKIIAICSFSFGSLAALFSSDIGPDIALAAISIFF